MFNLFKRKEDSSNKTYFWWDNSFDRLCNDCKESKTGELKCMCGETETLACHWDLAKHMVCEKCQKIQLPIFAHPVYGDSGFYSEWVYIEYHSIKENGIQWYIKARDKLIKKIEKFDGGELNRSRKRSHKIRKSIEGW